MVLHCWQTYREKWNKEKEYKKENKLKKILLALLIVILFIKHFWIEFPVKLTMMNNTATKIYINLQYTVV